MSGIQLERTLALIKPDAYAYIDDIRNSIENSGFMILREKIVTLTSEQTSDLFEEQLGKSTWPVFVSHMVSGEICVFELACVNAIQRWATLMGPEDPKKARETHPDSLRGLYGSDLVKERSEKNLSSIFETGIFFRIVRIKRSTWKH